MSILFEAMNYTFYLNSSGWNNFKSRECTRKWMFKNEIASYFPIWHKFELPEIVRKRVLKESATFSGPFIQKTQKEEITFEN
jgi:hypothetical protein